MRPLGMGAGGVGNCRQRWPGQWIKPISGAVYSWCWPRLQECSVSVGVTCQYMECVGWGMLVVSRMGLRTQWLKVGIVKGRVVVRGLCWRVAGSYGTLER